MGVIISLVLSFFHESLINLDIEFFAELALAFLAFYVGFSFQFNNFRFNEAIVYKLSLFDIFISLTGFLSLFFIVNISFLDLRSYLSYEELLMLILIFSVSSIGVIRHINQSMKQPSKLCQIAFEAISFQQFILFFCFVLLIFLSNDNPFPQLVSNKALSLVLIFFLSICAGIGIFIFTHKLKRVENISAIVLSFVAFFIFLLSMFKVSVYFPLLILGIFLGNSLKEREEISRSLSHTKELIFALIAVFAGLLFTYSTLSTSLSIFLGLLILARFFLKYLAQYISSFFLDYKVNSIRQFSSIFISHGRLAVALFVMMFLDNTNNMNSSILLSLLLSVLLFDFIGKRKYKDLLLEEEQETAMELVE